MPLRQAARTTLTVGPAIKNTRLQSSRGRKEITGGREADVVRPSHRRGFGTLLGSRAAASCAVIAGVGGAFLRGAGQSRACVYPDRRCLRTVLLIARVAVKKETSVFVITHTASITVAVVALHAVRARHRSWSYPPCLLLLLLLLLTPYHPTETPLARAPPGQKKANLPLLVGGASFNAPWAYPLARARRNYCTRLGEVCTIQ